MNTSKKEVVSLVNILASLGLEAAVISPGSRNAPLIRAFNAHSGIRCYSIVDERSAGFFAMGMAQQLQKPVAVVCTSGSALLNIGPAAAEAFYQGVPLLIISADRPSEWLGQADGQTINQHEVFRNFTRGYFEIRETTSAINTWHNKRTSSEAYHKAMTFPRGPVHINVPLSEPLYDTGDFQAGPLLPVEVPESTPTLPPSVLSGLSADFNGAQKIMILAGQHHPDDTLRELLHTLSGFPQVAVLTETTSNLFGNGFTDHIDRSLALIREGEKESFRPEILITLGGMVVTKRLKQFLRQYSPHKHWHIDPGGAFTDTYQSMTHLIQAQPATVLAGLLPLAKPGQEGYNQRWGRIHFRSGELHTAFLSACGYSDLKVFDTLLRNLPGNSMVQLGNSTPVRYAQLCENLPGISHFCNRGVSGIDGCTSTAVGAAVASGQRTILLSGELSFLYDANGLWNKYVPEDFTAVVINNGGGNIFRIIEGPDKFAEMSEFIETAHSTTVKPLADMHGFRYFSTSAVDDLKAILGEVFDGRKKTILEIFTPREESPAILKAYWTHLSEA